MAERPKQDAKTDSRLKNQWPNSGGSYVAKDGSRIDYKSGTFERGNKIYNKDYAGVESTTTLSRNGKEIARGTTKPTNNSSTRQQLLSQTESANNLINSLPNSLKAKSRK